MKFVLFLSILLSIFSCQKRPNANIENDKCFNLKKERNAYADFKPVDKKLILDIKYPNLEFEELKIQQHLTQIIQVIRTLSQM